MELENEAMEFKFKNPEEYINKLDELNGGMNVLLDELKKLYVTTLMEPDNKEVRAKYQATISNINLTQSKILSMSNDLQSLPTSEYTLWRRSSLVGCKAR